jgi:hypothetical protein
MNALLDAALGYAARGIPVYPVHWPRPIVDKASLTCSCRHGPSCDRPAKHPLVGHGVNDATTEVAQLERWWRRWPQANLGLPPASSSTPWTSTGASAWPPSASSYQRRTRWLPGPVVRTGGGGWHYWFAPTGLGNRPPRGLAHVDWRGIGGCVLAPPSRHASGRTYRWVRGLNQVSLPEVPTALRGLLDPDPPTTTVPAAPARPAASGHSYGRRVLADELAALGRAAPGHRNRTLNRTAFKVYRYVASGLLDDQEVTLAFTTAGLAIGLNVAEVGRTLASARTAGLANPRTVPAGPGPNRQEDGA